ncbi:MAG: BamA/TamA family outer membrane protein [Deltaproteobacteria bacterium]|nr:BamA/TamA family outer membrane protein [Deltaproteobacteria bacterium]
MSIGLEDPDIPESRKRVIISVVERGSQYVETRAGFSTGEGFRVGFEYGHRNVAGQAIALTVRLELGLLPDLLILDQDVRENYGELTLGQRLERRNSGSLRFPEIGLGPLVSLTVDGIDLRDNHRDFGQTKEALLPTLGYRPWRDLSAQLGASVELNDVQLFAAKNVADAIQRNPALASLLRVPDGRTIALGQRLAATWDRRDNAFAATSGTLLASGIEHVSAFPSDEKTTIQSEFLRFTAKAGGYLRLSSSGAALALSVSAGYNLQLTSTSQTYPDRLFYLGGVDSGASCSTRSCPRTSPRRS